MADELHQLDEKKHDAALASMRAHLKCACDAALDVSSYQANRWAEGLVLAVERADSEAHWYQEYERLRRIDEEQKKAEAKP